jgi:hypothetical protein
VTPDERRTELEKMPNHIALALRQALAFDAADAGAAMGTVDEMRDDADLARKVGCTSSSMLARCAYELGVRTGCSSADVLYALAAKFLDQILAQREQLGGAGGDTPDVSRF